MSPLPTAIPIAFLLLTAAAAQDRPGDAARGVRVFEQERCVLCHSIHGSGGKLAPDLGRRPSTDFTPSILAATLWNHAPVMWREMAVRKIPVPKLEPNEVADLFAYFYAMRYFDPPGDAARGKRTLMTAGCIACHGAPGGTAPPVSSWKAAADSVAWAQQMWNHSAGMVREAEKRGIRWPSLTEQQLVDLMVYVQNLPQARRQLPAFRIGDPGAGEKLFQQYACARCHTIGETATGGRIDLLRRTERFRTLIEFAVAMWNHGPQMHRRAAQIGVEMKPFRDGEMADLLAYLFEKRYLEESGDARRGVRIYKSAGCASCHESGAAGAPRLTQLGGRFSSIYIASALWKHGPRMLAEMEKRRMAWPSFAGTDLADLSAYLNQ